MLQCFSNLRSTHIVFSHLVSQIVNELQPVSDPSHFIHSLNLQLMPNVTW